MEQFDTLPMQYKHIEHMHEGVWFRKNNFWQNDSCENLDNFSLKLLLYMRRWCLHWPINSYHRFLMEQFDTLPIQYRHIEHMHEGVWFRKKKFWQNDSCENLDNFSLKLLLYTQRQWKVTSKSHTLAIGQYLVHSELRTADTSTLNFMA